MKVRTFAVVAPVLALASMAWDAAPASRKNPGWNLSALPMIAKVDRRFQSYNIEMVEVTGGRFWAPYGGPPEEVYRQRPPIDLANPRLRRIASLLGPAYVRISGTWANNTYVPLEGEAMAGPPPGFKQVLGRDQWRSVIAFSRAVDAPIITSFAVSAGTRDAAGRWQTDQAQRLLDLTRAAGGKLAGAEFFNEPNLPSLAGVPAGYNEADYLREFAVFHDWARRAAPEMKILGPGSVGGAIVDGKVPANASGALNSDSSQTLIGGTKGKVDAVSYHFYGSVSQRCAFLNIGTAQKDEALSPAWLDKTLRDQAFFADLRDRFEPGKPLWLTETAQAACGGSPWASSFLDTFRYLNQLGVLAQRNVQVVMHNTLAASDYALIDGDTLEPRPSFWAAVLWRRTMGQVVLASPPVTREGLRIFAHCLPDSRTGIGLLAINTGTAAADLPITARGTSWTLRAVPLDSRKLLINGREPALAASGQISGLAGRSFAKGLIVPAHAIVFARIAGISNPACR
ncbi:MAG: hypothetical protein ABL914_03200 [Novosphingobium sp.]|uniref:hypothetical protein n=1 Tax=Novosphingobium sp. TaxID=1874826 RepID=UPI0032BBDAE3